MKNKLLEIRKSFGVKQCDLAMAIGVTRQTMSALEKGHWDPSIKLAYKIARYFDKQIEDVFIFEE
jgi:putative transcriptional regulator